MQMQFIRTSIMSAATAFCLSLVAVVLPPMPASADQEHTVPYGTPIVVRLDEPITSYHLKEGMGIPVRVVENVVVDGCIVIRRGAFGVAEVIQNNGATVSAHNGSFMLRMVWVRAVDHSRIGVDGYMSRYGQARDVATDGNALIDAGSTLVSVGAVYPGLAVQGAGGLAATIGDVEKGGEATAARGEVIRGHIANIWGVNIASDIPAAPGEDESPIK